MLLLGRVWSLMKRTIREFIHEEVFAAKYTESEAQKHSKEFI